MRLKSNILHKLRINIVNLQSRSIHYFNWLAFLPIIIPLALLAIAVVVSVVNEKRLKKIENNSNEEGKKQDNEAKKENEETKEIKNAEQNIPTFDRKNKNIEDAYNVKNNSINSNLPKIGLQNENIKSNGAYGRT